MNEAALQHAPEGSGCTIVLVLDHAAITGGQTKVAIESAIGLKAAGYRVVFFAACGPVDTKLVKAGIEVVCLDQSDLLGNSSRLKAAVSGIWNRQAAAALLDCLNSQPRGKTLVHVHGWAKALSPAIASALKAAKLPSVYTLHEYFLFCPNGGFYNYQTQSPCKLAPMSAACMTTHCDSRSYAHKLWRVGRQAVISASGLATIFDDVIYLTELARSAIAPFAPATMRLHHVPNPVDAINLGPKADATSGEVLFVGRLSPEKGPFLFAEAASKAGCVPVFIGDGPSADDLRSRFPQAKLLGWKNADEVKQAMRAAKLLVFPSLWYETFGLTAYEALALGTPVIVSDGCAAREAVMDGKTGFHFKSGDADDFAAKIRALQDKATLASFSKAAYEAYWLAPPDLARHTAALTAIYAKHLGA